MDPEKETEAYARVRVVLEFKVGVWGSDCRVDQVFDQAANMAIGKIRNAFPKENPSEFQIVGVPVVETILVKKSR